MIIRALLMGTLFLGSIGLIQYLAVIAGPQETNLSALARRLLGGGTAYHIIQAATAIPLTVDVNTGFAGLPRPMSVAESLGVELSGIAPVQDRFTLSQRVSLYFFYHVIPFDGWADPGSHLPGHCFGSSLNDLADFVNSFSDN
jgi:hypothetical protein